MDINHLSKKLNDIPDKPGIYIFKDTAGDMLYIGKAKSLKKRVTSYFQDEDTYETRIRVMLSKAADIDVVVTDREIDALILESNFIKKYKPRYNIMLKDDKSYPYIKLSVAEKFPRFSITRRVEKDGSLYFGPYTPAKKVRDILKQLQKVFPLKQCRKELKNIKNMRPCLSHQMDICLAPCASLIAVEDYHKIAARAALFLKGKGRELISGMRKEMIEASRKLNFENAARQRDRINTIQDILEKQEILSLSMDEQDVIAYFKANDEVFIQILFIRNGRIIGKRGYSLLELAESDIIYSFIKQYYGEGEFIPKEIIIKDDINDRELLQEWLSSVKGEEVYIKTAKGGRNARLIKMAEDNAKLPVKEADFEVKISEHTTLLKNIKDIFLLKTIPSHIEAFDISNISGKFAVGSMVLFRDGTPVNKEYRKYKIKWVKEINDTAMLSEIIFRRYSRIPKKGDSLPDLILVDGGKGQLSAAAEVLKGLEITIDVMGIAKGRDRNNIGTDEIFINDPEHKFLSSEIDNKINLFLHKIRDEAHRFAIGYHRGISSSRASYSELDNISGIGKRLKLNLLKHFGSIQAIKTAGVDELTKVNGINRKKGEIIVDYFLRRTS